MKKEDDLAFHMSGKELRQIRREVLRLGSPLFGRLCGVHASTIRHWELKERIPPTVAIFAHGLRESPEVRSFYIKDRLGWDDLPDQPPESFETPWLSKRKNESEPEEPTA